jgi:uncharacterized protein involved in response to NO
MPRPAPPGPALLSAGFRPFFLFGALYAAGLGLVWTGALMGRVAIPTTFSPVDWHVHEFLYGGVAAAVAGFLLTAIPNWTGRLPIRGAPLAALVAAWLAGRVAVSVSAHLPALVVAAADLAFLVLLGAAAAREIVAGRNWRNLRVLAPLAVLVAANALFHWEAAALGEADVARRLAVAAVLALVMLIAGRIVPSFTRNWLVRENPGRLPAPFGAFDAAAMGVALVALLAWIGAPASPAAGVLLLIAGALHAARLARWAGERTLREPLLLVLHVAYAFVPLGFGLAGLAAFGLAPASAGQHAWTVGAMGGMTLAVMSRATLGHTGGELTAGPALQAAFLFMLLAALARLGAALLPEQAVAFYHLAAVGWAAAYLTFVLTLGPRLVRERA